jgi:hypothetical protein
MEQNLINWLKTLVLAFILWVTVGYLSNQVLLGLDITDKSLNLYYTIFYGFMLCRLVGLEAFLLSLWHSFWSIFNINGEYNDYYEEE